MNFNPNSEKLFSLILAIWKQLPRRRRRQFWIVMLLMPLSAITEVISLGAVLPFLGVLVAPDKVFKHPLMAPLVDRFELSTPTQLLLPITVIFVVAAVLAGAIRMLLLWSSSRVAYASGVDLSGQAYRKTLYQPYIIHASRNSTEVINTITSKINTVVFSVLIQIVVLCSSLILLVAILLALVTINAQVATIAGTVFGSSYAFISWISRHSLRRNGNRIAKESDQAFRTLQEGLGGIRDVLLESAQPLYCEAYSRANLPLSRAQASNFFLYGSPRYAMEALGISFIAALAYAMTTSSSAATAVPVLGALALGAQRLLPALQQLYSAWAQIMSSGTAMRDTLALLEQPLPSIAGEPVSEPFVFKRSIKFEHVYFRYPNSPNRALDDVQLEIPRGARVGFVGPTGSGKTTCLDVIMGLLPPERGRLLIDEAELGERQTIAWQRAIAHVPQQIHLSDATIAENIAFGVRREAIDMERVRLAAQQARISDFIENRSNGYESLVGERGIRLSGGQRQRIGIARALYKRAPILTFDEATSALDNITEQSIMDAIDDLDGDLTIILVAHRLTTVRRCNVIFEFEGGRLIAQGSFDELVERSATFRRMTMGSHLTQA